MIIVFPKLYFLGEKETRMVMMMMIPNFFRYNDRYRRTEILDILPELVSALL